MVEQNKTNTTNSFDAYVKQMEQLGRDWLDGKLPEGTNFNGLILNPKQEAYVKNTSRSLLACGGMSCLHGDTKILNADTLEEVAIKDITKPFRVFSWNGKKVVKAYASVPIKFKKEHLYKVKTPTASFVSTANHRVLTSSGYVRVSELVGRVRFVSSSQDLRGTISVSFLSRLLSNALCYLQTGVSFLFGCLSYLRLCGQRFHFWLSSDLASFPLQVGAPSSCRHDSCSGGHKPLQANTFLSRGSAHLSNSGGQNHGYSQPSSGVNYNEEPVFGRIFYSFPRLEQFVNSLGLVLHKVLRGIRNLSYLDDTTTEESVQVSYHSFDNFYDFHVFGTNNYLCQGVFHHNSGKTLGFIVKLILLSQYFPGSKFLIGRKTQGNAEETFMKDFMEICPPGLYNHSRGYHKITFTNGSEAEFWGLDALQSGASTDIKKAEQKLKSHNFSFIFIDQLEEIEKKVFDALQTRMRRRQCKHNRENPDGSLNVRVLKDEKGMAFAEECLECHKYTFNQFCATMNPANHWSYDFFKVNPRAGTDLIETSTLDNKAHLTEQFIENELTKPEMYKAKYFYGIWDDKSMVEGGVFYEEHILNQRAIVKEPIRVVGGIRIFEEPENEEYQIGIDPSLGASDPCNITCVSKKTGKVVATYAAYVPTNVIAEKCVQIGLMYSLKDQPMMVPEATGVGQALVEALKPLWENIYVREVYAAIEDKKSSKLGFYTTHSTKTQLIENMKHLFEKGFPKVYDEDTVNELNKFIYTDSASEKGAGAQQGYHDDRVMGLLLAFWNVPPADYVNPKSKVGEALKDQFSLNVKRQNLNSSK